MFAAIAVASCLAGWLHAYYRSFVPELIMTLPRDKCQSLSFLGYDGTMDVGGQVGSLCRAHGVRDDCVFALRGRTAARFVADSDTSIIDDHVHGKLQFADADPNLVYFYHYHERFDSLIHEP